jgi:hypothetical protein
MSEDMEPGSHESTPVVKSTSVMRRVDIYGGVRSSSSCSA